MHIFVVVKRFKSFDLSHENSCRRIRVCFVIIASRIGAVTCGDRDRRLPLDRTSLRSRFDRTG